MPSLIDGELKVTGPLGIGNVSNPPKQSGGSGAIDSTNKPNGSVHWRTDEDTLPEIVHNSAVAKLALAGDAVECRMSTIAANTTTTYTTYMPRGAIITGVDIRFLVKPSSAGGTVVIGITVGGNQILASASEDLEGLVNDTLTALSLTATSANLDVAAGAKVVITVTSNNADMTGGTEPIVLLKYNQN